MNYEITVDAIIRAAEERYGIKADPDDARRLQEHIAQTYGEVKPEALDAVFASGEAAGFLTVNETYFFREPAHFTLLRELLPAYAQGIRICSAAAASGAEAYSIAMLLEAYNRGAQAPLAYHIDAFDINPGAIETAIRGLFGSRAMREDGSCLRYMADPFIDTIDNGYRVACALKENIRFFIHNLLDRLPSDAYDVIFFRNAFIYFTAQAREKALANLCAALKQGGLLFTGVSETAAVRHPGLAGVNRDEVYYFQKTDSAL